ncbi:MAG: lysylphosphatidylglycerol synthase domain-containing protein [Bacteroidia bacterium]
MKGYKNIITWAVKIGLGLGSFLLIYWRLSSDLTADKAEFLKQVFSSAEAWLPLCICLLLVPVNWGIESYKWKLITTSSEPISFGRAMASVYAGVCAGNLAPGRATEFVAKIMFFTPEKRSSVTILHFVNGMFQLSVTLLAGLVAVLFKFNAMGIQGALFWPLVIFSVILLAVFGWVIFNFNKVHVYLLARFAKKGFTAAGTERLGKRLITALCGWSLLRYIVFSGQLLLIISLFYHGPVTGSLIAATAIYFLLTTALPMISIIEPAIRAAIALAVFGGLNIPDVAVVIIALLLWVVNIVIPSIIGYILIAKEDFDFKSLRS